MTTIFTGKITAEMPTRDEVLALAVGDVVNGVFGPAEVVEIYGGGFDVNGRAFSCFYLRNGETSKVSGSVKEDTIERSLATSRAHTSAELDAVEWRERARRAEVTK
jgi:hypothetical protein